MKPAAFVAFVALLVSGCMVGPDYSRPPVLVPDNYRFAVAPATAESIADLPWFEVFRDPVLQELVREALRNNYDLRIAAARVEEARAQIGIARS
jgi:multidrug efflux system outer membrane protein